MNKNTSQKHRLIKRVGLGFGIFIIILVGLYFFPTYNPKLSTAPSHPDLTYKQAVDIATARVTDDTADANIKPECRSVFKPQPEPTTKVVVLMHGYTACPDQMEGLANALFAKGYTVYIPRATLHGEYDHDKMLIPPAVDLVAFASDTASVAKGLSPDAGMIGLSGGGVLTAWTAHYRPDAIKHVELLDPFFEPAVSQSPKWQLRAFIDLYGLTHILPDVENGPHGSYRGLAQYVLIGRNTPDKANSTNSAALILAPGDTLTDLPLSQKRFAAMFPDGKAYGTPMAWNFEHDNLTESKLGTHATEGYAGYIAAYENAAPASFNALK